MIRRLPLGLLSALVLVAVVAVVAVGRTAHADVAPDPGYVESCTVDKVRGPDEVCESCRAWHGDVEACANTLGKDGYSRRCQTRGASAWSEVWCKKAPDGGGAAAPVPPTPQPNQATSAPPPQTSGCSVSGAAGSAAALPVVLALAGLAARRRRRS